MRKIFTVCLVLICLGLRYQPVTAQTAATISKLSTGTWFKIGITQSGIYKLDAAFLKSAGLAPAQINPQHLQIFGNGGGMLPQPNNTPRPDDLLQNAIWVAGEADGKFDTQDYILFYGQGPHRWQYQPANQRFKHEFNIYTDTAYYFITVGTGPGKRVKTKPEIITAAAQTITTYTEHQFLEQDIHKPLPSGREWYGDVFNSLTLTRQYNFPAANLVPGSTITIGSAVMASSATNSQFTLKTDNATVGTHLINGQGSHNYHTVGEENLAYFSLKNPLLPGQNNLALSLHYNQMGNSAAAGYLNYLEVITERYLRLTDNQIAFRTLENIAQGAITEFKIENITPETQVWDITNPVAPQIVPLQKTGNTALFKSQTDSLREFISFNGSHLLKPAAIRKINNQNLHALNLSGNLDFVIITHPLFKAAAERLAQHRRTRDQLNVAVVTINEVYNEFSSGAADVTAIRDLMRLLYQRSTSSQDGRLYLLLFGDASYDYKSEAGSAKTRTPHNTNFVPVYQSRESLDPLASFSSEDYYGLLDAPEGYWSENNFNAAESLDIGIGRLPAKTSTEAQDLVNKIIRYESPDSQGNWRNQITFLADDGDNAEHLNDAESLAGYLTENQPAYHIRKIYLDLFKQTSVTNGQRSPETNAALKQTIDQGTLLLNYTGHGNEVSLAHEQILTLPEINDWQNQNRLFFMLTATCEFGRYDDPRRRSGAEAALLNPKGGAIGLLTTTRPVFASHNRVLNRNFFTLAFTPTNGKMPRLGEIYRQTKNKSQAQANNRNFTLLADPTLRLAYPQLQANITHLNNAPLNPTAPDTLKALEKITLNGSISNQTGLASSFNGAVKITLFEKPVSKKTFGDESNGNIDNSREVQVQENIIYNGTATVKNGIFTSTFVLPKNISGQANPGKISLYAYSPTTDAHGANTRLLIGGAAKAPIPDTTPPQIKLYLNDQTFVPGGLTNETPQLLALLSDSSGINTSTTQSGHEIIATLDQDPTQNIVLNAYYTTEPDNYQAGKVIYTLPSLAPGKHTLSLTAWDTHNNAAEASIDFLVLPAGKFVLQNTFNSPNPFLNNTVFNFSHNLAGDDINIQIQVFNTSGHLVKTITTERPAAKNRISDITWNGKDNFNRPLAPGLYLYRIVVQSVQRGISTESVNKLIILN